MSVFGVILVPIFPYSDWIWRYIPFHSVYSPNTDTPYAATILSVSLTFRSHNFSKIHTLIVYYCIHKFGTIYPEILSNDSNLQISGYRVVRVDHRGGVCLNAHCLWISKMYYLFTIHSFNTEVKIGDKRCNFISL